MLQGPVHAALPFHFLKQRPCPDGQLVGQFFDGVRASGGIDHPAQPGFLLQDDLHVARDSPGEIIRRPGTFIVWSQVHALSPTDCGSQRFGGDANHVHMRAKLRLVARAGAGVDPHPLCIVISTTRGDDLGPEQAGGSQFGDLH